MGAILRVIIGFIVACIAAGLVQVLFVTPPNELLSLPDEKILDEMASLGWLALFAGTQFAVFSAPFALIAALVGEWQRVRAWPFYGIAGMLIAGAGFLAQYASENSGQPTIANTYGLASFLAAGLIGGLVYWMLAGARAGGSSVAAPKPVESVSARPNAA